MEKVRKPLNPAGGKRQRKISQSVAVIEPKKKKTNNDTKNKSETIMKKKKLSDQSHTDTSKVSTDESIPVETQPHLTQTPKKKKRKPKTSLKSGVVNTNPITNVAEVIKPIKRQADTLQVNPSITATASPMKKKKKHKQMLTELNELKEQIIGPTKLDLTEANSEKPAEKPKKVKTKTVEKEATQVSNEEKYPVLNDKELIDKFMGIPLTNNQKGRIREAIKLQLHGSEKTMFPDIINGKIQAILRETPDLTGHHLRRIRVLYNMLKTSLSKPDELTEMTEKKKGKKKEAKGEGKGEGKDAGKKKGPKRYVVFLGNLPLDVNKEKIMNHFCELNEHIKDIRFPPPKEGNKSAIAYVELSNEPSYELALSKHHSMLGSRRIKVLYTTQKGSKITRAEAKGKSAKLIALQHAGKLIGSVPTKKKRSHRRAIMKQAKKAEEDKLAVLS